MQPKDEELTLLGFCWSAQLLCSPHLQNSGICLHQSFTLWSHDSPSATDQMPESMQNSTYTCFYIVSGIALPYLSAFLTSSPSHCLCSASDTYGFCFPRMGRRTWHLEFSGTLFLSLLGLPLYSLLSQKWKLIASLLHTDFSFSFFSLQTCH